MPIDWKFIGSLEKEAVLRGYVPAPSKSSSGVTIATGFDIGQRNTTDLSRLGLPAALIKKLSPYCLLKKWDAVAYLKKHPLTITASEARTIDRAVKTLETDELRRDYDKASTIRFDDLPDEAATVIASVEFQYGSIRATNKAFWKLVTTQKWKEAVAKLRKFGDAYDSRRQQEADYLEKLVFRLEAEEKKAKAAQAAQ